MPIQSPQWTDFLTCSVCYHDYDLERVPISLACSHTVCRICLSKLNRKQCPFDQTKIRSDVDNLPINHALLRLASNGAESNKEELLQQQISHANIFGLSHDDLMYYVKSVQYVEEIALFLKRFSLGAVSSLGSASILSRPMQKKIITILNCQLLEREGQIRALRAARSIGERTVTELLIHHQNPQQLSSNLWAAIRSRGCQFLGPAMQEEVLKLVLLALEDGSAISRKVLVMFIVQRLEPHFPQASKTSIGHVVQLLYRASCFTVSKRECDSSLMELKSEFRTYEALRREHDTQIVEIALDAGLRIAPDQWSALLYGDTTHKSHMQSIIDKLQTPESFVQSVQELTIVLQRTADPENLFSLRPYLECLADIDVINENCTYTWENISKALEGAVCVAAGLVKFISANSGRKVSVDNNAPVPISHGTNYKTSLCRAYVSKGKCPRGIGCTFAHSEQELTKYRIKNAKSSVALNRSSRSKSLHNILPVPNGISDNDNYTESKYNHSQPNESVSKWSKYELKNTLTGTNTVISSSSEFCRSNELPSITNENPVCTNTVGSSLLDKSRNASVNTFYAISDSTISSDAVNEPRTSFKKFCDTKSNYLDCSFSQPFDSSLFGPVNNLNRTDDQGLIQQIETNTLPVASSSIAHSTIFFPSSPTSSMSLDCNSALGTYNTSLSSSPAVSENYCKQMKKCPASDSNMYPSSTNKNTELLEDETYNDFDIVDDMKKLELRLGHELDE